jgi:hypothetical protein
MKDYSPRTAREIAGNAGGMKGPKAIITRGQWAVIRGQRASIKHFKKFNLGFPDEKF